MRVAALSWEIRLGLKERQLEVLRFPLKPKTGLEMGHPTFVARRVNRSPSLRSPAAGAG